MAEAWMRRRRSEAGLSQLALIIIIIVIVLLLLAFGACYYSLQNRGGTPNTITIPSATLAPGVPTTLTIQMPLNHPLPTGSGVMSFRVRIDEDDVWDDTLGYVTLSYDPQDKARPYAHGTVTLVCNNLRANGVFDLQGPGGTSTDESTHQVHGEETSWFGITGANANISCVVPTIPVNGPGGSGVAGTQYCLYKVDSAPGNDAAYNNNTVCVPCAPSETHCPTNAILDLGEERKWQVTNQGQTCQACPAGARVMDRR